MKLTNYSAAAADDTPNTVTITIDDAEFDQVDFGRSYSRTIPLDELEPHAFRRGRRTGKCLRQDILGCDNRVRR